jgi:hypothetical protein
MATQETDHSFFTTTDAEFRAYVLMWINAMIAMGLVRVAQTGEINEATVLTPTALNQDRGFVVFKFNDALATAGKNVYIKLNFGSCKGTGWTAWGVGGANYNVVRVSVQVGTEVNGSGTLSGVVSLQRAIAYMSTTNSPVTNTAAAAGAANKHLFSGSTNRICAVRGVNTDNLNTEGFTPPGGANLSTTNSCLKHGMFAIERSKDSNGVDTDDGIIFIQAGNTSDDTINAPSGYATTSYFTQYIPYLRPAARPTATFFPTLNLRDTTDSIVTSLAYDKLSAGPIFPQEGLQVHHPGINCRAFYNQDFAWANVGIPISVYGTSRLYRPMGDFFRTMLGTYNSTTMAASRMMMLWE